MNKYELRNYILSKKLDNKFRKELKENYGNLIEKEFGNTFNEKLYNLCFPNSTKEYKSKKLKFVSFQKGYDFTQDLIKNENDALLFLQYRTENNLGFKETYIKNEFLKELWNKIPGNTTEKLYRIKNNILFDKILCPVCKQKEAKFQRYKGFTYCSHRCAQLDEKTRNKAKETCKQKYGVEYAFQSEKVREKYRKNYLKKYGVNNPFKQEDIKQKIKETNLKKYGVEHPVQNKKVKQKIINTLKQNYGIEWNSQINQRNMDNFNKKYIEQNFIKNDFLQFNEILEYFNISESYLYKKLKEWNIEYDISSLEYEINKKYFNKIFKVNDRKLINPFEIDLLNYDKKIGIEFDGLLWHSFGIKPDFRNNINILSEKKYHLLEKTELVEEKGFQLFHIFENEWKEKRDIWISVINNKLGLNEKIYARNCIIKEIPSKKAFDFFQQNHLQGGIYSKINLGLFYNNELVSVMSFSKPRFDKNIEWELIRFASKLNINIIGGASKLLKCFERNYNPKSIISYANRRWSKGDLYEKLGFEFIENTKPNYYYYKDKKLYSRMKFQKHKLKKYFNEGLLEYYNENETELIIMIKNKYRIIYDCGNKKYIKEY